MKVGGVDECFVCRAQFTNAIQCINTQLLRPGSAGKQIPASFEHLDAQRFDHNLHIGNASVTAIDQPQPTIFTQSFQYRRQMLRTAGNIFEQDFVGHIAVLGKHIARCERIQHPAVQGIVFDSLSVGDVVRIPSSAAMTGYLNSEMFGDSVAMIVERAERQRGAIVVQ